MQPPCESYVIYATEARQLSEDNQRLIKQNEIKQQQEKEAKLIQGLQDVFAQIRINIGLGLCELDLHDNRHLHLDEQQYLRSKGYNIQDVMTDVLDAGYYLNPDGKPKYPGLVRAFTHQRISWK